MNLNILNLISNISKKKINSRLFLCIEKIFKFLKRVQHFNQKPYATKRLQLYVDFL